MAKARKEAAVAGRKPSPSGDGAASAFYASKLIKAGALLADTKTLLAHWDLAASVQENLGRIRQRNV